MAIAVMAVIIILNVVLLLAVMRIGTMEDAHDHVAAEQSGAVMAWRARLASAAGGDNNSSGEASTVEEA